MHIRIALLLSVLFAAITAQAQPPDLWFYYQANLLPEENIQTLEQVWRRASAAGYSKVLLADYKFALLGDLGENTARYQDHVAQVRKLAQELHLEIVPAIFNVGYSNSLLTHDPNLAEGLPVKDALFVVDRGEAHLVPDPPVSLSPTPDSMDGSYRLENGIATTAAHTGNARLIWKLNVSPYRCYHVSVRIKTDHYTGQPEIKPIAGRSRVLAFTNLKVAPTQDWTEHHVVFDSLDNQSIGLYMGVWGDASGTLKWKDWKIEEVGLLNVLRREGAPCVVKGYQEGKDYDPIRDPKLGMTPFAGEYDIWHRPPTIRTSLPDGTQLRVSWYFPMVIHDEQVMACPSEQRTRELLAEEAHRVRQAFAPRGVMMSHDEVRLLNWDRSCQERGLTPGQILADNVAFCTRLLPTEQVYVWSDMFDPYHNAVPDYYLVNGTLAGSCSGLDQRVTIVNWNFDQRDKSLAFFAARGHRQVIAAYYDGPLDHLNQWLDSASKVPAISGIMYTTWERNYDDLERFAQMVKARSK